MTIHEARPSDRRINPAIGVSLYGFIDDHTLINYSTAACERELLPMFAKLGYIPAFVVCRRFAEGAD